MVIVKTVCALFATKSKLFSRLVGTLTTAYLAGMPSQGSSRVKSRQMNTETQNMAGQHYQAPACGLPHTPRQPYTGPDMLTTLANEVLLKVFAFLHAPGESKWTDKTDLKSINSIRNPRLCKAVREELFRHMLLKFSCEGAWNEQRNWTWDTPKLITMLETEPTLRGLVKEIRVHNMPVSREHSLHDEVTQRLKGLYRFETGV